jgi:Leucine-rich repeat (LRR) protein
MLTDAELRKATLFKSLNQATSAAPEVYKFSMRGARTAIAAIPEEVRRFTHLQVLDASGVPIRILPEWIGELTNLQVLTVDETNVAGLPASITKLSNLHTLKLAFNSSFASGVQRLHSLTGLHTLSINGPTLAAIDIAKLTNLESLLIEGLSAASDVSRLYGLSKLKSLELCGDNGVLPIPSGISALTNLESLKFLAVEFPRLPEELAALLKLKTFGFSGLGILTRPEGSTPTSIDQEQFFATLSRCAKLREVDLHNNDIMGADQTAALADRLTAAFPKLKVTR